MFRKRKRRRVPGLNTTSTADISFMLLIFFLVTTSLDTEKGLLRRLPPPPQQEQTEKTTVKEDDLMNIAIDGDNRLTCNGETTTIEELTRKVASFVAARPKTHVLSVAADRNTSYDTYFNVQNALVAVYNSLRDGYARKQFGHPYRECSDEEKELAITEYPQRISEAEPEDASRETSEGGGR